MHTARVPKLITCYRVVDKFMVVALVFRVCSSFTRMDVFYDRSVLPHACVTQCPCLYLYLWTWWLRLFVESLVTKLKLYWRLITESSSLQVLPGLIQLYQIVYRVSLPIIFWKLCRFVFVVKDEVYLTADTPLGGHRLQVAIFSLCSSGCNVRDYSIVHSNKWVLQDWPWYTQPFLSSSGTPCILGM